MIYLFFGEDQFSLTQEVNKIKQANLTPDAEDFNFAKIDALKSGFTIDDLFQAAEAYPFLSEKRVVIVSNLMGKLGKSAAAEERALARGTRSAKSKGPGTPRERFLEFIPLMPTTTVLILVEEKAAKNDLIYKAVDKHGAVREFLPLKDFALEKWIGEHAAQKGIKLERGVAELLRSYVGSDLYRLANEVDKLAAYAGVDKPITPAMVELLTAEVQETKIWDLTDALAERKLAAALRHLNRMRNETTLNKAGFTRQVFGIISKQVYDLVRIRDLHANRKTNGEIAAAIGMHPFRVEKSIPLARKFTAEHLDRLYARLTEMDYADKSGRADLATQLDLLIAEICQAPNN